MTLFLINMEINAQTVPFCFEPCPWSLQGNDHVTAIGRAFIPLNSTCTFNNFIGTRAGNIPTPGGTAPPDAHDLVFGTLSNGWMRLTTTGGLFLSDRAATPTDGNIKIGWNVMNAGIPAIGNRNVLIGQNTANSTFTQANLGDNNVFIGTEAGRSITGNVFRSIFLGTNAGANNRGSTNSILFGLNAGQFAVAQDNILIGTNAGQNPANIAGATTTNSIFIGRNAGANISGASNNCIFLGDSTGRNSNNAENIFIGSSAGINNTNTNNIFIGQNAGRTNQAAGNTFIGHNSGSSTIAIIGNQNTFLGTNSGQATNGAASNNTFIGMNAGRNNGTVSNNTFIGSNAGQANTVGFQNVFVGSSAGTANTASRNVYIGHFAALKATTGTRNVIIGDETGNNITFGNDNTVIGDEAGQNLNTGTRNTFIGQGAGNNAGVNNTNTIAVGVNCASNGINGSIAMGNDLRIAGTNSIGIISSVLTSGNNIIIGNGAVRLGFNSNTGLSGFDIGNNGINIGTSIGISGPLTGNDAVSIGTQTISGAQSIAIGNTANAGATNCIVIGNGAQGFSSSAFGQHIAIGFNANSIGGRSIVLGNNATSNSLANDGIAIGTNAQSNALNAVAIGLNVISDIENEITIGQFVPTVTANAGVPNTGDPSWLRVGIGTGTNASGPGTGRFATTRFHVNCNNLPATALNRSGVRFEDLQLAPLCSGVPTNRQIFNLVIDNDGYVYQDAQPICEQGAENAAKRTTDDNSKSDSLQKQIDDLKAIIATMHKDMDKCCDITKQGNINTTIPTSVEIKLYQNIPNPFTIGTEIKFFVPETVKQASLMIYDLNGREIRKIEINERNESSVKINGKELAAGMYIYSLIVDNTEIDSKRMILTSK